MKIIRRLINKYKKSTDPIAYAKKIGVEIGEDCCLIGSPDWGSEPWLISIGNHTEISYGCSFITHDGATWVFREQEPYRNTVKFGRIKIGNNCFVGSRTILLPGVVIGDNSIVGAGSVVSKSIPAGEVWAGVPARFISTTSEYAEKCRMNTPNYNLGNYRKNFVEETKHICDLQEEKQSSI